MTYKQLSQLKPEGFKRRCGVHLETFEQMVAILLPALDRRGKRGGQCKLSVEDQLLVVLEYWREYRTQFHIATTWGLSESAVCQLIQKVEGILIKSSEFRLPGKKQLYQTASIGTVVAVDVTESPIVGAAFPKGTSQKKATLLQRQEKAAYPKSSSVSQSSHWTDYLYRIWQRASP